MLTETSTQTVVITTPHGLHVRLCSAIVNTVRRHQAEVTIQKNGQTVNAASILELMSLGAPQGAELALSAKGPDAKAALESLARLFANEFEILCHPLPSASQCERQGGQSIPSGATPPRFALSLGRARADVRPACGHPYGPRGTTPPPRTGVL